MQSVTIIQKSKKKGSKSLTTKYKQIKFLTSKQQKWSVAFKKQKVLTNAGLISKIRKKTAQAQKMQDRNKIYTSLNIIAAPKTDRPSSVINKKYRQSNTRNNNICGLRPQTSRVNTQLSIKQHRYQTEITPRTPYRIKNLSKMPKVRIMCSINSRKHITMVISVDFILNEFYFWDEEQIEESSYKIWKKLSSLANVIWIVRSNSSVKKIQDYSKKYNLHLDGILLIENQKHKYQLKISLLPLQQQMNLTQNDKLLVINTVRADSILYMNSFQFKNSLPVVNHPGAFVHFAKIDMNNANRFQQVLEIISRQLPDSYNIRHIFQQHCDIKYAQSLEGSLQNKQKLIGQLKIDTQARIALLSAKQNLRAYFEKIEGGLNKKIDDQSMHFIIGDLVRRNLNISRSRYIYGKQHECYRQSRRGMETILVNEQRRTNLYHRPIFLWDF